MTGALKKKSTAARHWRIGLPARLLCLTILIALLIGAPVGVTLIQTSRGVLREQIIKSNLAAAGLAAHFAEKYFDDARSSLVYLSSGDTFREEIFRNDLERTKTTLAEFMNNKHVFDNVAVYTAAGLGRASGLGERWRNKGGLVTDRDWFIQTLATKKSYLGPPLHSRGTGQAIVTYTVPLFNDAGRIFAVLAGDISLIRLSHAITSLQADAYLLDIRQGGVFLAHPDPKQIMTKVTWSQQAEQHAVAGERGTLETKDADGSGNLAAFVPVAGLPWSALTLEPLTSAFAPLASLTFQEVLSAAAIVMIIVVLGIMLARSIVRPAPEPVKGAAEIGRGNLDSQIKVKSRDEIGHPSTHFNRRASDRKTARQKRTEEAYQASELRYRRLFETAQDGILILDAETGMIIDVNPYLIEMLGFSHEQFTGKKIWELGTFTDVVSNRNKFFELKRNEYVRYEDLPLITAGGRKIEVEFVSNVYTVNGGKVIQCNIRDITERKRAEERLRELNDELKRSNRELEQFAYVASHDLQEPLRMVSSYAQLIEKRFKGTLDQDTHAYITFAVDGANRMQRLIQDLLVYSRIATCGRALEPVDMSDALGEALLNLQAAIVASAAQITHDDLPVVSADKSQLVQLFQNLIDNAVKFHTADEPPRVHIGARRLPHDPRLWQVNVADNGIGINPDHFERIFLIFQRLHGREEYPGTGIGLAICQRIVGRHGGRLWVESVPGQGSVFCFTLNGETKGD